MNGYDLSRNFCNWAFENPDKVKPIHYAIFYFAIEHCNRLGWKDKFGLPSQMVMEAIGVKNWRTYAAGLHELVEFGFIEMVEISKNQYSSNIIAIVKNTKAPTKALDKALSKHSTKHCQSTVSIVKQETINKEQIIYYRAFGKLKLTDEEFKSLNSEYSKQQIDDVLDQIENYKNNKNYVSLYLTAKNWLKRDNKQQVKVSSDPLVEEMKRQRQMYGLE